MNGDLWTPAQEQTLRDLVGRGMTALQIARTMGLVSRNAAIGKIFRLGLKLTAPRGGQISGSYEREDAIRKAWIDGLSISDIGRKLCIPKQTMSAWIRRLELPPRQVIKGGRVRLPISVSPTRRLAPCSEIFVIMAPQERKPVSSAPMAFLEAENGRCKFPTWGNKPGIPVEQKFYCGSPAGIRSYCDHHANRCFGIGSRGERNAHKAERAAA